MQKNKADTVGIDGNQWYLLWGDNLQTSDSYFARTIGEIRAFHKEHCGRELATGNKWVDFLAHSGVTPEQYQEAYVSL